MREELLTFHLEQTRALAIEAKRCRISPDEFELRTAAWQLWCHREASRSLIGTSPGTLQWVSPEGL